MNRLDEITTERNGIERKNKSLRQRLSIQREQLEQYLAEANRYAIAIKRIENEISENTDRFFRLGEEARKLKQ